MKAEKLSDSYSSSCGRSSNPSKTFLAVVGLLASASFRFCFAAGSSSSLVWRKRSRTRSVSIDPRPAFCWVTTEFAILSLKRWRLKITSKFPPIERKCCDHHLPHNLLFKRTLRDQSIYIHHFLLSETVGTIHGLEILHWVPIMFDEDDGVCASEGQSEATNVGS